MGGGAGGQPGGKRSDSPKPPLNPGLGCSHSRTLAEQRRRPGKKAEKSSRRGCGDTKRRVF